MKFRLREKFTSEIFHRRKYPDLRCLRLIDEDQALVIIMQLAAAAQSVPAHACSIKLE